MGGGAHRVTDAIILAGGFGTRLRAAIADVPKPLAPVNGKPFLDHQLTWLAEGQISRAIITAHFMADQIARFADARTGQSLSLEVLREATPLGTGGAVKNAMARIVCENTCVVLNGDTYYTFDLGQVIAAHARTDRPITMAIAKVENCARFGTVTLDGQNVTRFNHARGEVTPGLVSCGLYMIDTSVTAQMPDGPFSMERDFFPTMARQSAIAAHVVDRSDAFIDFGTPESYAFINRELSRT